MEKLLTEYSIDYILSSDGILRNAKSGRVIKSCFRSDYLQYTLRNPDGTKAPINVHRLVAKHFLEKAEGCDEVNHINGIKTDNRVENLEWISRYGNIKHYYSIVNKLRQEAATLRNEIIELRKEKVQLLEQLD